MQALLWCPEKSLAMKSDVAVDRNRGNADSHWVSVAVVRVGMVVIGPPRPPEGSIRRAAVNIY